MIGWTEQATRQLDHAHDYIALSYSEKAADRIILRIMKTVERLREFPMSGRHGRVAGTRELVVRGTPFIVAYSVTSQKVLILAVYHAAQRWPDSF